MCHRGRPFGTAFRLNGACEAIDAVTGASVPSNTPDNTLVDSSGALLWFTGAGAVVSRGGLAGDGHVLAGMTAKETVDFSFGVCVIYSDGVCRVVLFAGDSG